MDQTSTPKSRAQRTRQDTPITPIAYWPTSPAPDEMPVPYRPTCPTASTYPTAGRKVAS